jgi:hypothetical protein
MSTAGPSYRRPFSPLASWQQVHPRESQAFLRQAFTRWGRPQRLRVDNGTPWGATDGLPTGLELWLAGLAVGMDHNPACRPQDNGVVERSQGTGKNWAEPGQCDSVAQLQHGLDEADARQRDRYPYAGQASRSVVLPELAHSGRSYSAAWERRHWQWALAEELLAGVVVARQVDKAGCVSLYSRNRYVGKSWAGQRVWVRYDPEGHRWMFSDAGNRLLAYREAPELSQERIVNLTATDGRSKRE